jgi:hypothetical protein
MKKWTVSAGPASREKGEGRKKKGERKKEEQRGGG